MVAGLGTAALILSLVALFTGTWCLVEVLAMKKSTHQIQMVNPSDVLSDNKKELEKFFDGPKDDEMFV